MSKEYFPKEPTDTAWMDVYDSREPNQFEIANELALEYERHFNELAQNDQLTQETVSALLAELDQTSGLVEKPCLITGLIGRFHPDEMQVEIDEEDNSARISAQVSTEPIFAYEQEMESLGFFCDYVEDEEGDGYYRIHQRFRDARPTPTTILPATYEQDTTFYYHVPIDSSEIEFCCPEQAYSTKPNMVLLETYAPELLDAIDDIIHNAEGDDIEARMPHILDGLCKLDFAQGGDHWTKTDLITHVENYLTEALELSHSSLYAMQVSGQALLPDMDGERPTFAIELTTPTTLHGEVGGITIDAHEIEQKPVLYLNATVPSRTHYRQAVNIPLSSLKNLQKTQEFHIR